MHRLKVIAAALVLLGIFICSVWIFFTTAHESGISTYEIDRKVTNSGTPATTAYSSTGLTSDFQKRCSDPGVIRCVGFDSPADISGGWGDATGIIDNGAAPIELDKSIRASGSSSLKFTIPPNSSANTSGSYFSNFSEDLSIQFGEGDEFYIQWRQRFSPEFLDTIYNGGGGWKQTIIGEGDHPGQPVGSCTQLEIVTQNTHHRGFPQMYHSCGGKDGKYQPLSVSAPHYDYLLQNAIPGCLYSLGKTGTYVPPCVGYKPDQWMTFQVRIKIGTWYKNDGNYHKDSTIQLWVAEEDKPSQLIIDFSPETGHGYDIANTNPEAKYGKIWLLPYNTGKSSAQNHPVAYTWYDELIISRTRIPDPTSSTKGKTEVRSQESGKGRQTFNCEVRISNFEARI